VFDDGSGLSVAKVPSTPSAQAEGVLAGMERLSVQTPAVSRFVHGTTVSTNAVLERTGARTVLVTTEGFRDLLEIGRQTRPKLYDLFADRPSPLVPRDLVVEAAERIAADGSVVRALEDPASVKQAVGRLDPEAVAVCLLFSFLRPEHERAIGEALAADGMPVSLSSEVLPMFREYERASTTALNAYVAPILGRYLAVLVERLGSTGLTCEVEVMRSGGGTFSARMAERLAVDTLLSGPAAGAWGAAAIAREAGVSEVIAFDMGGTSTDATLIEGGKPRTTSEGAIDGLPFAVTSTDIHTVGAGGGSIGWRDAGGALRVGPRSAGADPGPACYGQGGREPTVTDAYLLLGLLDPTFPLGGVLALARDPAEAAVGRLASSVGMSVDACSEGMLKVLEAGVAKALRVVSVERGRDPRRYALLAFGGAGPIHQGPLARELGCPLVIVPRHPGVLSAMGLLAAPLAVDLARTVLREGELPTDQQLEAWWGGLEREAGEILARQGVDQPSVARSADCRYRGQAFEIEIPASRTEGSSSALRDAFESAHLGRYGYTHPGEAIEIVTLRVRAEGPPATVSTPDIPPGLGAGRAQLGSRRVVVDGHELECAVFDRDRLGVGDRLEGTALVGALDSTCLILPGQKGEVDAAGNLLIREG
jgi:N-methylhydantoinase A